MFSAAISLPSGLGIIALMGVIINDGLVLILAMNKLRATGEMSIRQVIVEAGRNRFRAVALTSITTFVGLMPLLFEQSAQAQFIIPMAISLSFGILFATVFTLILVPLVVYMIDDVKRDIKRLKFRKTPYRELSVPAKEGIMLITVSKLPAGDYAVSGSGWR